MAPKIWASGIVVLALILLVSNTIGGPSTPAVRAAPLLTPPSPEAKTFATMHQCLRSGVFSKPGSCRDYYHCEQSSEPGLYSVYLFSCPAGTVFDPILISCESVHLVIARPECMVEGTTHGSGSLDVYSTFNINSLTDASVGGGILKRDKRFAIMTALTAAIAIGSLTSAASGIASAVIANKKSSGGGGGGIDLRGIENKLVGIDGKLNHIEVSILESQAENRISSSIIQSLITKGTEENRSNFKVTQRLINKGILENQLRTAETQGLIIRGNAANVLNFARIQVSIGELKQFISQEVTDAKTIIKRGFESVSIAIDRARVEPLVSKLLSLIRGNRQRSDHLQGLPEENQKDEIERSGGYLEYLESSTLQDTLYDIIQQNFAIPSSASDISSAFILDFLIHGLQVHLSMMSSIISSNVYLASKALDDRNLEEFNTYMLRVRASVSRVKISFGHGGRRGLIQEVKEILDKVQKLPYASEIHGFSELLTSKIADMTQIDTDIETLIRENTELREPGTIRGKLDFTTSNASLPIGSWENGKQVSYALLHVSERGLSRIGRWSTPYTILDKANPTIQLPAVETGVMRIVYRRFNQEKPEVAAVIRENSQTELRDIIRDIINSASRPNEEFAIRDTRAFISAGADVNVFLENNMTPLHYAARHGNVAVMDILIGQNADVHAKSSDNEEALHFAALYGAEESIDFLLTKGATVNSQTRLLGLSALHIAVANSHMNAAQALIRNNAFVNIKDNNGLTPLHVSVIGNGDTIDVLLESSTIDVNSVAEDGLTPLHYAARSPNDAFVRKLLQHRDIEVSPVPDSLLTPLHLAAMSGNVRIISALIQHGASASAADRYGYTPLHYAAFYGNREAVLALIQVDESVQRLKNSDGKIARDLAVENNWGSVVEILGQTSDDLIQIIAKEIQQTQPVQSTPATAVLATHEQETSNCSNNVVENLAKSSEETCVHIGNVESYVNTVTAMVPLQIYYESQEEFSQIFGSYDRDLLAAKEHAKIWRNGDSIVQGIRQTFELAREFEPEFSRKYKVNQQRVEEIKANVDQVKLINDTKDDLKNLEEQLVNATTAMDQVQVPSVLQYFEMIIADIQSQINEKKRMLAEDFTLIEEMEELVDFLEFVRRDSSKIQVIALKTKGKIETFRDHLVGDKGAFERHARVASESFERLQNETIKNNRALEELKRKQDDLEKKIEAESKHTKALYAKMNDAHAHLRDMRRKLLDKMNKAKTMKIIGAIFTPLIIGIGLLVHATKEEKKTAKLLQDSIKNNKEEVDLINSQIKNNYNEIKMYREMMANSTSNSDKLKNEMHDFITLDGDLQTLASEVETLLQAINKAIVGVVAIKDVFDDVTKKLGEMIDLAKTAKTEASRLNAKFFIYNELSLLECNWRDVYLKVMNLDECTRNFQILY